ncbi:MAG: molybdopterin-dependent oxidoreductase [Promethearchaeota archaeon]
MNRIKIILVGAVITVVVVAFVVGVSLLPEIPSTDQDEFPDFFTKNEDYFVTRIGAVPEIDRDTYQLEITGLVENPTSYSLTELQSLEMIDLPLTIECIGNSANGRLVSTAIWRGFSLYDLLDSLGIMEGATRVKYSCKDGYFATHTMDQVENNGVLGALYMNEVEIPPLHGFPLRFLLPGHYGVKQPAWVTEVEVIDTTINDYWDARGWDTSPPIAIDSKIFFPNSGTSVDLNQNLRIGGCAFGGTRVKLVEYTIDDGATWNNATIVEQIDADNVWVFWEINTSFSNVGEVILKVRATDINDNQQIKTDYDALDGTSSWPAIVIKVI